MDLNPVQLGRLKDVFLSKFVNFESDGAFRAASGDYFDKMGQLRRDFVRRAGAIMASGKAPAELGRGIFQLMNGAAARQLGFYSSYQTVDALADVDKPDFFQSLGELLVSQEDLPEAVDRFLNRVWPTLELAAEGGRGVRNDSRLIPTLALALTRPLDAFPAKFDPVNKLAKALEVSGVFRLGERLTAEEYRNLLDLAGTLFNEMRDRWEWRPVDLWDVQAFVWTVTGEGPTSYGTTQVGTSEMHNQTTVAKNTILYGPPGTGKTYRTSELAVQICNPEFNASGQRSRQDIMTEFRRLVAGRRIAVVTFHQSYTYEDFVEGYRPLETAGNMKVQLVDGLFKRLANAARENPGPPAGLALNLKGKRVFKMSLGRADDEEGDRQYVDAMDKGYLALGYGGEVDWSAEQFGNFEAIKERWRKDHPDATGNDPNIRQTYTVRAGMREGDLVVVSAGNLKFRAIGEIVGPYKYVVDEQGGYPHRRNVRWLWRDDAGQSYDEIYGKQFSQVSAYELVGSLINWNVLSDYIARSTLQPQASSPEPYVLIIDEINRANVSKVFGELLTLLEADKRLGEINELQVRLPYSQKDFGVPQNLYIIGTMNTADRSIALLDTALRRRFDFEEIQPEPTVLEKESRQTGINLIRLLSNLNDRIETLFDRDHRIGHAYFIGCSTKADVDNAMRRRVIPLLAEYFYEDWGKVGLVLNEPEGGRFLQREPLSPSAEGADIRFRWTVRTDFPATCYDNMT